MEDAAPHPVGHNQGPPLEDSDWVVMLNPAVIRDQLDMDYAPLAARRDELTAGGDRFFAAYPKIETEEIQEKATEFSVQLGKLAKQAEEDRKREITVFQAVVAAIQKWFNADIIVPISKLKKDVEAKMEVYAKAKAAREKAAREAEAARLEAEAEKARQIAEASMRPSQLDAAAEAYEQAEKARKAASASPASMGRTRGHGAVATLVTKFGFEVTDEALLPRAWLTLDVAKVNAAISAGLRDGEDGTPAIPGGKIVDLTRLQTRG